MAVLDDHTLQALLHTLAAIGVATDNVAEERPAPAPATPARLRRAETR